MAKQISNPLLAIIKEQGLIDDIQHEEVVAEHKRAGTAIIQILQTPVETLSRMGQAGAERVALMHDARKEAAKLVKLFEAARHGQVP